MTQQPELDNGVEVRGVIAMNGRGELCFFAHSRGDGVPLFRPGGGPMHAGWDDVADVMFAAEPRRVPHTALARLDHDYRASGDGVPDHDCDTELQARADYSPFLGTPAIFECSCGKRYGYEDEESEGAAWELLP